jgi:hypothetical protein
MPILYENMNTTVRKYSPLKFSPSIMTDLGIFAIGVLTGLIIVPIVVPITGYQLTKRFGPPPQGK